MISRIRCASCSTTEARVPAVAWWKEFYARERTALDLDGLLDSAPEIDFPEGGALVFPHTRLAVSGAIVAAVAKAVARTRRDVLPLGVLHDIAGGNAEMVAKARADDPEARRILRGVHDESGYASEEFSLDGFRELHARACAREGTTVRISTRFPFLVGDRPDDLPGLEELGRLAKDAVIVATADPIHHGVGYETPEARDETIAETKAFARARIEEQWALSPAPSLPSSPGSACAIAPTSATLDPCSRRSCRTRGGRWRNSASSTTQTSSPARGRRGSRRGESRCSRARKGSSSRSLSAQACPGPVSWRTPAVVRAKTCHA